MKLRRRAFLQIAAVLALPLRAHADSATKIGVVGSGRVGGPVAQEQAWLIYRSEHRLSDFDEQFEVGAGITASTAISSGRRTVWNGPLTKSLMEIVR